MKVIMLMVKKKEMVKLFQKVVNIIQGNGKMMHLMAKENFIIKMEKSYMKAILLIRKEKDMENIIMELVNIMRGNIKII